ncbi:MAG TPA: ATP-binding cassette domain-containing protein [Rhizobacter sp.]|nr:ATP-binding cassette domain-containing protein [Rhizobacter sp.]
MTQISLRGLQKNYASGVPVIRNVDIDIPAGRFCVFLGPSGCGKSTLLRMIAGIEPISAGELLIGGRRMNEVPAAQRQVAMVFQNYALYPHMSVYENMAFGLRQARVDKTEIDRRVRAAAETLQIVGLLDRLPKALSGGQRQRVAIGRAIVRRPHVFLFDEPLSNLDAALRVHMRAEIARLHREFDHASAVYVTHDQTEAMALAHQIVLLRSGDDMLRHGSVAQVGSPLELYRQPRDRFVAGFLGSPRMNFLPAAVEAVSDDRLVLRLAALAGGDTLTLRNEWQGLAPGQPVCLGIRPEHMLPGHDPMAGAALSRAVLQVEHFGDCCHVYLGGGAAPTLIAKLPDRGPPAPGSLLALTLPVHACHLFDEAGFAIARSTPC